MVRRRSLPALSAKQEAALWQMVAAACDASAGLGRCGKSAESKTEWRRHFLATQFGITSLKEVSSKGAGFARVMAALQVAAGNGIDWIIKADAANPAELLHHVRGMLAGMGIAEGYARGIAKNALKLPALPQLDDLSSTQLGLVVKILYGQGNRIWAAQSRSQQQEEPF